MRKFKFFKICKKFNSHSAALKKEKISVMFPGQGFQFVGMLNDFVYPKNEEYQSIINIFDDALFDSVQGKLSNLMTLEKEESDDIVKNKRKLLNETKIAQPAILLHSLLNFKKFTNDKDFNYEIENLFGPSLGEIISLVVSDALSYEHAATLLYRRGECMQESCPFGVGSMLNVVGDVTLSTEKLLKFKESLEEHEREYINVSSINSKRLIVLSGKSDLIERCMKFLKENSIACKKLPVSGAFHSKLMERAQTLFRDCLLDGKVKLTKPKYKILSTVQLSFYEQQKDSSDFDIEVKELLIRQLTEPVDVLKCAQKNIIDGIRMFDMNKRKFIENCEFI